MKIVIFLGSPRKGGNTELLVDEILRGAKSENKQIEVEKVYLNEKNIKLCQGLEECREAGKCPIVDDCENLFEKIKKTDVVILASPNYWAGITAQLKMFLDRWGVFLSDKYESRIEGKKMVFVGVCGNPNVEHAEYVINDMKKACMSLKPEIIGELKASASKKGDILDKQEYLKQAFVLGKNIIKSNK